MSYSKSQSDAAREVLIRRMAREDILHYANAIDVPGKPGSEDPDTEFFYPVETTMALHHRLLLSKLYEVSRTKHGRMMVFMPPGSAKSTYASVVFPSDYMGAIPGSRIILASYGDDLARKLGRRTRSIIKQPRYKGIWATGLTTESSAAQEFALTNGSEYMACGILGGITGNRANGIIIDDPVKGRDQANSQTIRDRTFAAYEDDLKTRLIPGGWICIIQCMTGDTSVLMADGTETDLKNIKIGDKIATFENGKLTKSKVLNWRNNGPDLIYVIKMKSGIIVRANERHPFLVNVGGEPKWIRLKNIVPGQEIFRVKKESGLGLSAKLTDAKKTFAFEGIATLITISGGGRAATGRHQSTQNPTDQRTSNTDTESPSKNTTGFWKRKAESVPYVVNPRGKMLERIGAANYASIIATTLRRFGDYCATIAIWPSDTERHPKSLSGPLNTSDFILDTVEAIYSEGYEDVYDIQVERTENFIANGLVSHNTRWHEDDLSGRILPEDWNGESGKILCKDGNYWEVICLAAKCEQENDPLGREIGVYLWPEWFDRKHWDQFEQNPRTWAALFQQRPAPLEGDLFRPDQIKVVDAIPAGSIKWCRGWDLASSPEGDYTAGGKLGRLEDGRYIIADMARMRVGPDQRDAAMINIASQDGRGVRISIPQDPGQAGKTQVLYLTRALSGYNVKSSPETGDKITRAEPFAAQVNVGNVLMLRGDWNQALINEMRVFPNGAHDDQIDSLSRAFSEIMVARKSFFG